MEGGACDENGHAAKEALETSRAIVEIKIKTLDSQDYTCRVAKNVHNSSIECVYQNMFLVKLLIEKLQCL